MTTLKQISDRPIHIFIRHYREDMHSLGSRDPRKLRPPWYSSNKCILSLLNSVSKSYSIAAQVTIFFDGPESEVHSDRFLNSLLEQKSNLRILPIRTEGTKPLGDLTTFRELVKHITSDKTILDESIIYLCENDYLHHEDAINAISVFFNGSTGSWINSTTDTGVQLTDFNGLVIGDYLSLYDNPDYYRLTYHQGGPRRIAARGNCLYRQEKTLTASFATLKETLVSDLGTFLWKSDDFDFFSRLGLKGRFLYVSCPAYATHAMYGLTAPGVDWEKIANLHVAQGII